MADLFQLKKLIPFSQEEKLIQDIYRVKQVCITGFIFALCVYVFVG